jgi:hypothetical protein
MSEKTSLAEEHVLSALTNFCENIKHSCMGNCNPQQLGHLLLDQDFESLSARLQGFNLFRALRIEDYEIRHSNILAWLMDPNESHGAGQVFVKRILSTMLLDNPVENFSSAIDIELMDLSDLDVHREWRSIDLLLVSRKNGMVIMIENKFYSGEGYEQLERYQKIVNDEFSDVSKKLFVYLTLEGIAADNESLVYCSWSHRRIAEILHSIITERKGQLTVAVSEFIVQYIEVLRRKTMSDAHLVDMCKKIYRKHRAAIDTIVELAQESAFEFATAKFLPTRGFKILYQSKSWTWFMPENMYRRLPENSAKWDLSPNVSICCWIVHDYGDFAKLVFELCAMKETTERTRVIKRLENAGFKFSKAASRQDASYSRFYNHKTKIVDSTDSESVTAAIEKCIHESKDEFQKLENAILDLYPKVLR